MVHRYDTKDLKRIFAIPTRLIHALARSGQIRADNAADRVNYSFQDLLVLRMAGELSAADVPVDKIITVIENMRAFLPGGMLHSPTMRPLEAGGVRRAKERGVGVFHVKGRRRHPARAAQRHFERALTLEDTDAEAAQAAYLKSLAADAHHVEARINLGRLLHLSGKHAAAEEVYRAGLTANALLSYNLALLLEDLDRESEAILAYRDALAHDPALADAHFNLARLHERAANPQDAFRHRLAYRRLSVSTTVRR